MTVQLVSRAVVVIALLMMAASNWSREARAQGADELASLRIQVSQLYKQGKYSEAAPIAERYVALAREKHGDSHTEYATAIEWLAYVYKAQGRYAEAEPLYKRALAIDEKALGPEHRDIAAALNNLAALYRAQGRYAEAEPLFKRAVTILEKALGPDHPDVAAALSNLALLYDAQGRYPKAEPLYKRSLAIDEKALGPDHPDVATDLNNLAALYRAQGRYAEAEPLYKRTLAIFEKALGAEHPSLGTVLNNLAGLYDSQGRYAEAKPLYKRTLAIFEKALGAEHPSLGTVLNNLAVLYEAQGRYSESEPLKKRSLAIKEKALGPDHPDVATALNNLAALYRAQGRYAEAEPLFKRTLAILEKALGPDHPDVATALNNLAALPFAQGDWAHAAGYWQRATQIIERRAERGLGGSEGGSVKGEAVRNSWYFSGLIKVTDRLAPQGHADSAKRGREMFEKAQWVQAPEAASSLTQMAARSAKGNAALALLVRERQDLVAEWQVKDKQLIAARSELPAKRKPDVEKALSDRLEMIDTRLAAIDARFANDFPDYASVTSPKPASVVEVQALLRPNEALVLFLDTDERFKPTPEETFIWVVTKGDIRWAKSALGTKALTERVAALRCGLDAALWYDQPAAAQCRSLVKTAPERDANDNVRLETLPFDTTGAHALYKELFGPIEDVIKDKHLLIVPSGALTQLPFQVLVTAQSKGNNYRGAPWLARSHTITVLPAVSSLKALRRVGRPSAATRSMIGFGNPLLDGNPKERPWEARWAVMARDKQACEGLQPTHQVAENATQRSRGVLNVARRDGHADLTAVRSLTPLPDTADELCAVGKHLNLSPDDIWLGPRATETNIKTLSEKGKLAQYHVVHLATHGTLAGDISGSSEPGLIFTPPKMATDLDDGYLSASEVANLKLDADWVILSACNTAAGGAQGAEALSGLARAFIYAGARALLVSHWEVDSAATVKLITSAVGTITRDAKVGRAEALRHAMLDMIDKGESRQAHPAFWAPFVVVGEGGAGR
jgi:CHAT domain-containing protein/tetratricopeptide (TPR) repeat protein